MGRPVCRGRGGMRWRDMIQRWLREGLGVLGEEAGEQGII